MTYLDELAAAIKAEVPKELLPDEGDVDDLFRIYALLARLKGQRVTGEDVHDAWAVWMLRRDSDHGSVKPFEELDPSTRREDRPFVEAIRKAAAASTRPV